VLDTLEVVVAHPEVADDADPSTRDVLDQVHFVVEGLTGMGVPWRSVAVCDGRAWEHFDALAGAVVFNLLEAPPGRPQMHAAATAALELMGLPFTGSPAGVLWLTTDKIATRALLASAGLPIARGGRVSLADASVLDTVAPPWVIKPGWEDGSLGLEGSPVCQSRAQALEKIAELGARFPGQPLLAEHFLPGRELNVSLLANNGKVQALPPAEIVFSDFGPGAPQLVTFEAKWVPGSFADLHTVREFTRPGDEALVARVQALAVRCWHLCDLAGYARVDLRLDEHGEPHILEVNANPCLAADAGFVAAAAEVGLGPADVTRRIVAAAYPEVLVPC
jgi:D-alanine-D-alanine ligase